MILASGPSMSQVVADAARGFRVLAVSDTYKLAPWADVLYSCDSKWWHYYPEALQFQGLKVTMDCSTVYPILQVQNAGKYGFDPRPTHICHGGNSGYQAVHVAAHLGAKRILLCGFDMRPVGGKSHYHGDHPGRLNVKSPYEDWVKDFPRIIPGLRERGIEVLNCTPGSALKCFPMADLAEALRADSEPATEGLRHDPAAAGVPA